MGSKINNLLLKIQEKFNAFPPNLNSAKYNNQEISFPPIFIIAPPRSGSTLLYQLLIKYAHFSYISNIMALFPTLIPYTAKLTKKYEKSFSLESDYGYVSGLFSPNEAGALMRFWFSLAESKGDFENVRKLINSISFTFGSPLITKNFNNSLRIKKILEIFPNSKFIYLTRDSRYITQSIYLGLKNKSISRKVYNNFLNKEMANKLESEDLLEQSVIYSREIINQIDDLVRETKIDYCKIEYESLCQNPKEILLTISKKLSFEFRKNLDSIALKNRNTINLGNNQWVRLEALISEVSD